MKHMKMAEARARFGEILDQAESGAPVIIERHGVLFRLTAETPDAPRRAKARPFEFVDAAVMSGRWTWKAGRAGLRFAPRKKAR